MVLRLLAHNAEHWLSNHLNAYLRDDDEYRAITRETIIRGLAGTITYTPAAITVTLEEPGAPRVTRALRLLLDEINHTPPEHARRHPPHHLPARRPHLSIQQLTHATAGDLRPPCQHRRDELPRMGDMLGTAGERRDQLAITTTTSV